MCTNVAIASCIINMFMVAVHGNKVEVFFLSEWLLLLNYDRLRMNYPHISHIVYSIVCMIATYILTLSRVVDVCKTIN